MTHHVDDGMLASRRSHQVNLRKLAAGDCRKRCVQEEPTYYCRHGTARRNDLGSAKAAKWFVCGAESTAANRAVSTNFRGGRRKRKRNTVRTNVTRKEEKKTRGDCDSTSNENAFEIFAPLSRFFILF